VGQAFQPAFLAGEDLADWGYEAGKGRLESLPHIAWWPNMAWSFIEGSL